MKRMCRSAILIVGIGVCLGLVILPRVSLSKDSAEQKQHNVDNPWCGFWQVLTDWPAPRNLSQFE